METDNAVLVELTADSTYQQCIYVEWAKRHAPREAAATASTCGLPTVFQRAMWEVRRIVQQVLKNHKSKILELLLSMYCMLVDGRLGVANCLHGVKLWHRSSTRRLMWHVRVAASCVSLSLLMISGWGKCMMFWNSQHISV